MQILIDTHILLWAIGDSGRLSSSVHELLTNTNNQVYVSVASIWEIVIKNALAKDCFQVDVEKIIETVFKMDFIELPISISISHAKTVATLESIHKDPFDRILIAQTISEKMLFLTNDKILVGYSPLVHLI